ncbi:uncharacterized protein LOC102462814 [Pelodiscus sinensis]|uniref:uncharacterized protein LOC102462814 n=1 Tax=Pelodiscus sinensis TaxID=13735 RepID=UPI003F6AA9A7
MISAIGLKETVSRLPASSSPGLSYLRSHRKAIAEQEKEPMSLMCYINAEKEERWKDRVDHPFLCMVSQSSCQELTSVFFRSHNLLRRSSTCVMMEIMQGMSHSPEIQHLDLWKIIIHEELDGFV